MVCVCVCVCGIFERTWVYVSAYISISVHWFCGCARVCVLIGKLECIPVGCVPSTAGGCLPRWVGGCLPRGISAQGVSAWGCTPLPLGTEFLTHACENITFPQLLLRTVTSLSSDIRHTGYGIEQNADNRISIPRIHLNSVALWLFFLHAVYSLYIPYVNS